MLPDGDHRCGARPESRQRPQGAVRGGEGGGCALLSAIDPKTGTRLVRVEDHRRTREYAGGLREVAAQYPLTDKLRVVQDTLDTHPLRALYETVPAAEAVALSQRFGV